jgi:hypothetical protein
MNFRFTAECERPSAGDKRASQNLFAFEAGNFRERREGHRQRWHAWCTPDWKALGE